jgi:hypothetical protein
MIKKLLALISFLFIFYFKAYSQADDPCGAISIPLNSCIIGNNIGATDSANPNIDPPVGCAPVSANYNGADVWFSTIVGTTGGLQIDLTHIAASNFDDGVIAMYTGTCSGNLTIIECDDDSGIGSLEASFSAFGLTPGETVYIRAWEWGAFDEGTFNICVTEVTNPCNNTTPIATCGTTINATIPSGNGIFNDSSCGFWTVPGEEVIYSFTPTITGNYNITQISAYDHVNYFYSTSCSTSGWTCIDDLTINGQTSSSFPMSAGTTYYIMLDTEVTTGGNVSFTLDCPPPPPVCGGIFTDSGGPTGDYSNNENETTIIAPINTGESVTVTFTAFNLEASWDFLYVYDGPDTGSPLIATLTGTTIPGPFTSTHASGALTFVFESDGSVPRPGWIADITCTTPTPTCGDTFYDSGGVSGDYSDNENETTIIAPINTGDAVTATFTSFNLASGDTLEVFDGATSLGTFTGTTIPGPFTSTDASGELTFVFTSNSSGTQSGWEADITCSVLCNITITETLNPLGADECALNYSQLVANSSGSPGGTTTVYSEDFSNGTFPVGWNIFNGAASAEWIISNSNNAGGAANEAMLDWTTGSDFTTWSLSSPAIPIAGYTNLQLSFKQDLWQFGTDFTIYLESSLNGTTWTPQYTYANPPDLTETTNVDISALDGNNTLYLRFRFTGDSFDLFRWSIDDIMVTGDAPPILPQIAWTPVNGLYTDSGLTTPYIMGDFTDTVYAAPNGSVTYTATDQNNCTTNVTVTRNRKVWTGAVSNNWYDDNNWFPIGRPTINNCVVVPDVSSGSTNTPNLLFSDTGSIPLPPTTPGFARNLTVEPNGVLNIQSQSNLLVEEWINVDADGTLIIYSGGNLVQTSDAFTTADNTGQILMQRQVSSIGNLDYVYWSSPVEGFDVENISRDTNPNLIWQWLPTQPTGGGVGHHGDWINPIANEIMTVGEGYIVRGLSNTTTTLPLGTTQFEGRPNNGIIQVPITRGTWYPSDGNYTGDNGTINGTTPNDDNWNLIGNPYPSAISYTEFISSANNPYIDGTIYFWTHQNAPSAIPDPFYGDFVYNYDPADYIDQNYTGTNPPSFNGSIPSGQSFFVLMLDTAPLTTTTRTVTFNNDMRFDSSFLAYENTNFYRNSSQERFNEIERHRIWLDLISSTDNAISILIGYIEGATNERDRLYDGMRFPGTSMSFYSMIHNENMSIQGRSLPFVETDLVPLGIELPAAGNYSIAINSLDGLFEDENQDIYLEDTYLDFIHDLRVSPYSFNSEAGEFNDRFILRYTNQSLGLEEFDSSAAITISAPGNNYIKVTASNTIKSISIYDVLGRTLYLNNSINELEFRIDNVSQSDGILFVKVELENGMYKIQKVVLKH